METFAITFRLGDAMYVLGFFAALLGVTEVLLDIVLFGAVFRQKPLKAVLALLVKLALYTAGLYVLIRIYRHYVWAGAIGFGIGFFVLLTLYGVITLTKGKGERNT